LELPTNLEAVAAWNEIRAELRRTLGDSTYEIWIAPLEVKAFQGTVLLLSAPSPIQAWVAERFGRVLDRCAQVVLGAGARVAVEGTEKQPAPAARSAGSDSPNLHPRYSFDQFIIGDGNRLAHAAALAVAELPGQAYNPLFLHAPPGLGKTHLLHAIGNYVLAFGGGTHVRYTTAEAFTNHFIRALSTRGIDQFKQAYRGVDVLLIDDVQFLASKTRTEEEFFHTFNALYESGRQLVLSCDRLPRALEGIEGRLRERFESGLVADISPPDFHTRVAILRKRALLDRVPLAQDEVLDLIAERVTDNVRVLEGALIRIVAYHSLTSLPIDVALAKTVLDAMYPPTRPTMSIARLQAAVAAHYGLQVSELVSAKRSARIAWPRQVAISLARELTSESLQTIGHAFGGRNHATVLHACRRVLERAAIDQQASDELAQLRQEIVERR
jgi:chromosomal replication initiator protein